MVVQILDAVVPLDQLRRTLLPDPLYPGDTVGGIPLDRLDLNKLLRGHAVDLHDFGLVVQGDLGPAHFGSRQPHRHSGGHQLKAVPVSGGNDAVIPCSFRLGGQGSQNIVRLKARTFHQPVA